MNDYDGEVELPRFLLLQVQSPIELECIKCTKGMMIC